MPIVFDPAPPSPPVLTDDGGTPLWEVLYEALGFHRATDPATGYQLRSLCEVLMARVQEPYELVRERDDMPSGAILLDPDNAPLRNLPFLAQFVGAKLTPNMDEEQIRAEIKHPVTWRRGQVETIKLVAQRELTGSKFVIIRPRTPGPGHIYIRTLLSETPEPDRVLLELEEAVPAWDVIDYAAFSGVTVHDVALGKRTSVEALAAAFPTVKAVSEILPSEV